MSEPKTIDRTKEDHERLKRISENLAAITQNVKEIMQTNSEMQGVDTWMNGYFAYRIIEYAVQEAQSKVENESLLLLNLES